MRLDAPFRGIETARRSSVFWARQRRTEAEAVLYLLVSVIPGLAHVIQGRLQPARWYLLAWFLLLVFSLLFYGTAVSYPFLGVAIAVHAWTAVQGSFLFEQVRGYWRRLVAIACIGIILWLLYWAVGRAAFGGITGGYTALEIPFQNVRRGDYLLVRRIPARAAALPRGALVLYSTQAVGGNARQSYRQLGGEMIGQIVGHPGETVEIRGGRFYVDGRELDPQRYPVPAWLAGRSFSVAVPPSSYFVSSEFAWSRETLDSGPVLRAACLCGQGSIAGRAFIRWLPLSRRGFLKEAE